MYEINKMFRHSIISNNKIVIMKTNMLRSFLIGFGFLIAFASTAQDNRTLVTIADDSISVDDFMRVYKKNNVKEDTIDKKSVEEYLQLYINFKLKVMEAETLGMDTAAAFINELDGYREQLAEPYFVDESIIDKLLQEAYERSKEDLRVSHILIRVGPNAIPEDTLEAYSKILDAKVRIEKGESFADVARDVSEDASAREIKGRNGQVRPGNGGDLGYFTVFDMVYAFETGAYNTRKGDMSIPVRSDYGYHLIYVKERIPALGEMQVAHLFLKMPQDATHEDSVYIEKRIDSLYQRIQNGEKFEDLVKEYSDDKGSAPSGGVLPKFNVNRMVPEFIGAISELPDSGSISKPVITLYGWHIIKLISKTGVKSFEDSEKNLRKKIKKDQRSQLSTEIIIARIKKDYGYKENEEGISKMYPLIDSSIYQGKWIAPEEENMGFVVFTLGDMVYSQTEFAEYIAEHQTIGKDEKIDEFVNRIFKDFVNERCKQYENSRLEDKYPEFKAIVEEYRDGILLFDLTDEKVWSRAVKDTTGLKNYYDEHKGDFMWGKRLDASIYTISDTAYISSIKELVNKGLSDEDILNQFGQDSLNVLTITSKKFSEGDNDIIDKIKWKKGVTDNMTQNGKTVFVAVHGKIAPEPKSFNESKGLITAAYQDYLEKEWIQQLRGKYPVAINEEVLNSITK